MVSEVLQIIIILSVPITLICLLAIISYILHKKKPESSKHDIPWWVIPLIALFVLMIVLFLLSFLANPG